MFQGQDLNLRPSGYEPDIFGGFLPNIRVVDSPYEPNSWWTAGGQNKGLNFLHQPQAASLGYLVASEMQSRSLEIQ